MNLLNAIPEITNIIGKFVSSPTEKAQLESKLRELDIREIEALSNVQSSWLGNSSMFVSGAIPSMLWILVLVILFNFIISPLFGVFGIIIPILDLPEWYSNMCSTIILGLFAKKAWDSAELTAGSFYKKSKKTIEADCLRQKFSVVHNVCTDEVESDIDNTTKNEIDEINNSENLEILNESKNVETSSNKQIKKSSKSKKAVKDMTSDEVDERFQEILKEKGFK